MPVQPQKNKQEYKENNGWYHIIVFFVVSVLSESEMLDVLDDEPSDVSLIIKRTNTTITSTVIII